jgi:hypothetical protein
MTPAHVTTQLIARTDVELTKTVCEIHEDDVLDRARRVLVYVLDHQGTLRSDPYLRLVSIHLDV